MPLHGAVAPDGGAPDDASAPDDAPLPPSLDAGTDASDDASDDAGDAADAATTSLCVESAPYRRDFSVPFCGTSTVVCANPYTANTTPEDAGPPCPLTAEPWPSLNGSPAGACFALVDDAGGWGLGRVTASP